MPDDSMPARCSSRSFVVRVEDTFAAAPVLDGRVLSRRRRNGLLRNSRAPRRVLPRAFIRLRAKFPPLLSETDAEVGYRTCSIARSAARTIEHVRYPDKGTRRASVVRRSRPTPRRQVEHRSSPERCADLRRPDGMRGWRAPARRPSVQGGSAASFVPLVLPTKA